MNGVFGCATFAPKCCLARCIHRSNSKCAILRFYVCHFGLGSLGPARCAIVERKFRGRRPCRNAQNPSTIQRLRTSIPANSNVFDSSLKNYKLYACRFGTTNTKCTCVLLLNPMTGKQRTAVMMSLRLSRSPRQVIVKCPCCLSESHR